MAATAAGTSSRRTSSRRTSSDRQSSRRPLLVTILAIAAVAAFTLAAAPATAVPASVPAVRYPIGESNNTIGYNYGEAAPSARSLIIGANTRLIELTMPFNYFRALTCTMKDAAGVSVTTATRYLTDDFESPLTIALAIPAGRVTAGSGSLFTIECRDGVAGPDGIRIARFLLTEGAGAATNVSLPGGDLKLVSAAIAQYYGTLVAQPCCTAHSGQVVVPGNRVRVFAGSNTFGYSGRTNKATVTITSGSTTVAGLDVSFDRTRGILGFTIPTGLAAGRIDFAVKTVSTQAGTATTAKWDQVTRWADYATYDPNLDGKSFTLSPPPELNGYPLQPAVLTVEIGIWQPTPTTLTYSWMRDGVAIPGATTDTYRTVAADSGRQISVSVTATKAGLRTTTRTSAPLLIGDLGN